MYLNHKEMPIMNTINYMSKGFRDYKFIGFVPIEHENYEHMGLSIEDKRFVACYVGVSTDIESDDSIEREQKMIDEGKDIIIVFYGTDNSSVMRRCKGDTKLVIENLKNNPCFAPHEDDLFYNS